jgi:phosphosulfolactate synthase
MLGPGFLDLPSRSGKPRRTGITHVLDRGLPLAQATDLLERCESYVDVSLRADTYRAPAPGAVMNT